jgi:hypothetical protein
VSNDPSAAIVALVVAGLLALILRWVFKPSRPRSQHARGGNATDAADLGLLSVVASRLGRQDAMERRATLGAAGIRSSMSRRKDGSMDVLVFRSDLDRARSLLGP